MKKFKPDKSMLISIISNILSENFGVIDLEDIHHYRFIEDLDFDELDLYNLCYMIEQSLPIEIKKEDIDSIKKVDDLIEIVCYEMDKKTIQ